MKGCMVLQRRFAYVGHELCVLLKERGVEEFCGYVHMRESLKFLQGQKDIEYTSLILDEDIQKKYKSEKLDLEYLRHFEEEYGSVWRFIGVDRVVRYGQLVREYPHDSSPYTYEEMLRIVQVYAKHLVAFLEKERPDFVFAYQPGALGTLMLYAIAQKKGIPCISIVPPVTKDLALVSERYDRFTWADEIFKSNLGKEPSEIKEYDRAKNFIAEFKDRPVVYSNVYASLIKHGTLRQFEFFLPRNLLVSIQYIAELFSHWRDTDLRTDYTTISPYWYIWDRVKRKLRNIRGVSDLYDDFIPDRSFVFFPLHFEPELSILLLSPFDTNQIEMVKRLAQSVPAGMYVYVKEHPQMTPFRPRAFYKELKKIPNVKVLRPEISGFEVIRASQMVAIITGSAGWEATLLGKPVITFGEVFYNVLPSVAHSNTPEKLPEIVRMQLEIEVDQEVTTKYLAALFEDGAHCDLLKLWEKIDDHEKKREGLKDYADLIAKKLKGMRKS